MKNQLLAVMLMASVGCGTVLNGGASTIYPPQGGTIDGVAGPIMANKSSSHEVMYPNGQRCLIQPAISIGYLVADIVLLFLVGVIVDAVTGDWNVLDPNACPGVIVT